MDNREPPMMCIHSTMNKVGASVRSATTDPKFECFGCLGSQAFPLIAEYQAPDRDSIWVVWGGNSISDPVIY